MQNSRLNDWMQLLASFGVLIGIFLVFVEIRQANELGEADAVAGTYQMWESISQIELQTDINDLFVKSVENPEALTNSEIMDLNSWFVNVVTIFQRQDRMYDLGFYSNPSAGLEATVQYYFGGRFARAWFDENKYWIQATTPRVSDVISSSIESTPIQMEFEYIDRLKSNF